MNVLNVGDCLEVLRDYPDNFFDLVFTSPPYEAARSYGIDFKLKGEDFVKWAFDRFVECYRVCKGLTAWVIEGQTKAFNYSASPILLAADLKRSGVKLRKPPIFYRCGIPGSGGPDWLRNDYEFIICATKGRLPWSDNMACGSPPKYKVGGRMSHRHQDGKRKNATLSHSPGYQGVKIANPGNVINRPVGGGRMGDDLAHENEAPFPESLADFFVKSFCPPGGRVLDPFCGSGTTLAVAEKNGRRSVGIDVRESQIELTTRRLLQRLF